MKWAWGITTVPERATTLFPKALASLTAAGFGREEQPHTVLQAPGVANVFPRLFVDGALPTEAEKLYGVHDLPITSRWPRVRVFANWVLSLWELWLRAPDADRYALFQDDLVACRNLRGYLEACDMPAKGYWNLYTFPSNQNIAEAKGLVGWFESNQWGRGAVGLVFHAEAVATLLCQRDNIVARALGDSGKDRWHKCVDGAVIDAFKKIGWKEFTHNPSLLQHLGEESVVCPTHDGQLKAPSFRGEGWDAMSMVQVVAEAGGAPVRLRGEDAYKDHVEPLKSRLIEAWRNERQALLNAIAGDEARLAGEEAHRVRNRLKGHIERYRRQLEVHERNDPPYCPAGIEG